MGPYNPHSNLSFPHNYLIRAFMHLPGLIKAHPICRLRTPQFQIVGRLADQRDQRTESPEGESLSTIAMLQIQRPTMLSRQRTTRSTVTTNPPAKESTSAVSGPPSNGTATSILTRWQQLQARWPTAGTWALLHRCTTRRGRVGRAALTPSCGARPRRCALRGRSADPRRLAVVQQYRRCQRASGGSGPAGRGQ